MFNLYNRAYLDATDLSRGLDSLRSYKCVSELEPTIRRVSKG